MKSFADTWNQPVSNPIQIFPPVSVLSNRNNIFTWFLNIILFGHPTHPPVRSIAMHKRISSTVTVFHYVPNEYIIHTNRYQVEWPQSTLFLSCIKPLSKTNELEWPRKIDANLIECLHVYVLPINRSCCCQSVGVVCKHHYYYCCD